MAASINLADVAAGDGGFVVLGRGRYDNAGVSVAAAGDINGDGFADLIIGTREGGLARATHGPGEAYVLFGKPGSFAASVDLDGVANGQGGFAILGRDADDRAGISVASAGDINGDGLDDLIVGAYWADAADNSKSNAGESYLIFGKTGGFGASVDLDSIAKGDGGFVIHGEDAGDQSGRQVAGAGDINGDGFADLIIGAPLADGAANAAADAGDTYIVYGRAGGFGAVIDLATIAAGTGGFVIHGRDAADRSGFSVASAGDINGDRIADFIIGARYGDGSGNATAQSGECYVVFGRASGFDAGVALSDIEAGTGGFVIHGRAAGDQAGFSVASAGDINGDGFDDLAVGAAYAAGAGGAFAGESFVIFGKADGFGASISLAKVATGSGGFRINGRDAFDYSGYSVASAGDVNGDGYDDLLVGASWSEGAGNTAVNAGEVYVVFGKASGFSATIAAADIAAGTGGFVILAAGAHELTGCSVSSVGDLNGDGYDDLIVGAFGADRDSVGDNDHQGKAYVLYGRDFESLVTKPGTAAADEFTGTAGNDIMIGGLGDDTLQGAVGADALRGGAGNDLLAGGNGADRMDGGSGLDTLDYSASPGAVTVDLLSGAATGGDASGDHLDDFENLTGSAFADTLTGNLRANVLDGRSGADTLSGGNGADTYLVDNARDTVIETAGGGSDSVEASVSWTLPAEVETLTLRSGAGRISAAGNASGNLLVGNEAANLLNGSGGSDTLRGGDGSDTLNGGVGNDAMSGGAGGDTYVLDRAGDTVTEQANAGTDTVRTTIGFDLGAVPNVENLELAGGAAINGTGNGLPNLIVAGSGNNVIDGAGGTDTVSYAAAGAGVTASLAIGTAQATGGSGTDTLVNVERLVGSAFADQLTGDATANVLRGGKGNDTLVGGAGKDTLLGGAGQDTLHGGSGSDVFVFEVLLDLGGGEARDTIDDFHRWESDRVDLSALDADSTIAGKQQFTLVADFTTAGAEVRFGGGVLYLNTDHDVDAEYSIALPGTTTLLAGDLIL